MRNPYKTFPRELACLLALATLSVVLWCVTIYIWSQQGLVSDEMCEAYEPTLRHDLSVWKNSRFTKAQVSEILAASAHSCQGQFSDGSDNGLSLVRVEHGKAGHVVAGWGYDYLALYHWAEQFISRVTGNRFGRPDALKALTGQRGYDTKGKTVYMLVNDRFCDHPIAMSKNCHLSTYSLGSLSHMPVLSVAKIPGCSDDILIPFRNLFEQQDKTNPPAPTPWNEKINAAVWRGSMTGIHFNGSTPREIVQMAAGRTDTNFKGPYMNHADQLRYKVLVDADGNSYSRRLQWYFHDGSSAVLHGGYFEDVLMRNMVPGVHYERFEMSLASLNKKLDKLLLNDSHAREVASGGRSFGKEYITRTRWLCYMFYLVRQYSDANITLEW